MDKYLKNDIDLLIHNSKHLQNLNNKTIMITGATGLIGSILVKTFLENNINKKTSIKVLALCRNKEKFQNTFKEYLNNENLILYNYNIMDELKIKEKVDYIIHTAATTQSKELVERPVENIMSAILGTRNVLEFAKQNKIKGMVYLSSMEVYGTFKNSNIITEDLLGYVDLQNVRSCYPESKRVCELLCNSYVKEFHLNVMSARLAQTFGAGIPLSDTRIFAQIARSVIENSDIVLHTKGLSEANYCYITDSIDAIITILLKGTPGESYNVVNEKCHTTIKDMATMVCEKIANNKIKVIHDIANDELVNRYAPDTKMRMSSIKLEKLGWKPQNSLEESYKKLILSYKERMK